MEVRLSGRATETRERQPKKAKGAMDVMLSGRVTWVQAWHSIFPSWLPMEVMPTGSAYQEAKEQDLCSNMGSRNILHATKTPMSNSVL